MHENQKTMTTTRRKTISKSNRISQEDYLRLFKSFSQRKKRKISKEINKEMFSDLWKEADQSLPDISDMDETILNELRIVRYGSKA